LVVSIAKRYTNRGEHRAHAGGGEIRVPARLQVLHVRNLVDSPVR
jgi:hypothetical protein